VHEPTDGFLRKLLDQRADDRGGAVPGRGSEKDPGSGRRPDAFSHLTVHGPDLRAIDAELTVCESLGAEAGRRFCICGIKVALSRASLNSVEKRRLTAAVRSTILRCRLI